MAVAFESIASQKGDLEDLNIPKPSGLSVGDLMVAVVLNADTSGFNTPSGWDLVESRWETNSFGSLRSVRAIYTKVATSSDTSASDFFFDKNGISSGPLIGVMLRISGNSFSGADNIKVSSYKETTSASSGSNTDINDGLKPLGEDSLLVIVADNSNQSASASNYRIQNNNPTWTERYDDDETRSLHIATATYASTDATGYVSLDLSQSASFLQCALLSIQENTDATGTFTHLSVSPTLNTPSGRGDTNGSVTHTSFSPTLNTPSGRATKPTQWTSEGEASTNWTNESEL